MPVCDYYIATTDLQDCYSNPGLPRIILAISPRLSGPRRLNCRRRRRNRRLATLPRPKPKLQLIIIVGALTVAHDIAQCTCARTGQLPAILSTGHVLFHGLGSRLMCSCVSIAPLPKSLTLPLHLQDIHFFKMVTASYLVLAHLLHRFRVV